MLHDENYSEAMWEGPGTPSDAWLCMAPKWRKIEAVLGGTDAMRIAGQTYLPQHEQELDKNYKERLSRSVFTNITDQTLDTWTGKPFSEKLRVNDDVPQAIVTLLPDIDLCGNELQVFARNWFKKGLAKAFCHILVEYPRVTTYPGEKRTKQDDSNEGLRPYFVLIEPENVIAAESEIVQGKEVITHLRIRECVYETDLKDKFHKIKVHQIRMYEGGLVTIFQWRKTADAKAKESWVQTDQWEYEFPTIPLVTFYANREDFMVGKPPIDDLADLNIAHWQSESDQTSILTVTRFPQLAVSGAVEKDDLVVGPNRFIHLSDPNAKVYYVEHQGAAINAGERQRESLERAMHTYGTQFLQKQPGRVTATARTLDTAEATSSLQDAAIRFNDVLNQGLQLLGEWLNLPDGGTVAIQTEFGITEGSAESLQVLQLSRQNGDISLQQYVTELTQRGVLSDLFDPAANETEVAAEKAELEAAATRQAEQTAKIAAANKPIPAA